MRQTPNPSRGRRLDDPMPPTAARQQSAIFYVVSLQQCCVNCSFATITYVHLCRFRQQRCVESPHPTKASAKKKALSFKYFSYMYSTLRKNFAGCLCQKSFSVLLFMRQTPNSSRGRRLDDPMPPTAARQQSAIFYAVSLQQRYADCPFATIKYVHLC